MTPLACRMQAKQTAQRFQSAVQSSPVDSTSLGGTPAQAKQKTLFGGVPPAQDDCALLTDGACTRSAH